MDKIITYKSADSLPIYNYVKCLAGDYRYAVKADVDEIPDLEQLPEYQAAFSKLVGSSYIKPTPDQVRLSVMLNEFELMRKWAKLIAEAPICDKTNKDAIETEAAFWGLTFDTRQNVARLEDMKKRIKGVVNGQTGRAFTEEAMYESVLFIRNITEVEIDVMKCSTSMFFRYLERANDEVKRRLTNGRS